MPPTKRPVLDGVDYCGVCWSRSMVRNTRIVSDGRWRRRVCVKCGASWSTLELPLDEANWVRESREGAGGGK